jgi:hypothetical protein
MLISLIFSTYTFSQNKRANFSINSNPYSLPKDDDVDIMFVDSFNELLQNGEAQNSDRDLWTDSYYRFINLAIKGTYNIESVADYITHISYSGPISREDIGNDPTGLESNRKYSRKVFIKYPYMRMKKLTGLMCQRVLNNYRAKK